jgi:hypothetical protein
MKRLTIAALVISFGVLALAFAGAAVAGVAHDQALARFSINVATFAGFASAWTGWSLYRKRRQKNVAAPSNGEMISVRPSSTGRAASITRRDWWIGVTVVAVAILAHALFPRYQWRDFRGMPIIRVDRWRNIEEVGEFREGVWTRRVRPSQPQATPPATGLPPIGAVVPEDLRRADQPTLNPDEVARQLGGERVKR